MIQEFPIGKSLRLDCYVGAPFNLGFEYDGIQHSKSVDHFGGDDALVKGMLNDQLKEELCQGRGINLVRINHDEELTKELLESKIESVGNGSGHIKEGFHTNKEKAKEKNDRLQKRAKEKRREQYKKNKEKFKNSDRHKQQKERAKQARKDAYQRQKNWKANRNNKS